MTMTPQRATAWAAVICAVLLAPHLLLADQTSSEAYTVGPGDVIRVEVFGEKDLSGAFPITPTGRLTLPQVGTIDVGGLTLDQLRQAITNALSQLIKRPRVTVTIDELASERKVYVAGAVSEPGSHTLPFASTVLDAVIAAGLRPDSDLRRVTLTRPGQMPRTLDLSGWKTAEGLAVRELLRYGDIIFVPELTERISVLGAVNNPATIVPVIGERITVLDAIGRAAGGLASDADPSSAVVVHKSGEATPVDLRKLLDEGDLSQNIELGPGDVVVVPKAKHISVVGQVATPGLFVTGRPVPVLAALARAGQLLPDADLEHARIVSASGTRQVNLKAIIEKGEGAGEIKLNPGDVLVIPKARPEEVLLAGAVMKPGVLDISHIAQHDLLRIITTVGIRPDGDPTRVCILRGDEQLVVNYKAILEDAQLDSNVDLKSGDVVYVPSLEKIYVIGAVAGGGKALPCQESGMPVLEAITMAGGMTPEADTNQVHVVRPRPDGSTEHVQIKLGDIKRGKAPPAIVLKPGDIVYIGARGRKFTWHDMRNLLWTIGAAITLLD